VFATSNAIIDSPIGEAGDIGTAVAVLRYATGPIGTMEHSRKAAYGYGQRVEVPDSHGSAVACNSTATNAVLGDAMVVHSDKPLCVFAKRYMESSIPGLRALMESARNDTAPPATGEDGGVSVITGPPTRKSLLEGRPIKLSEIEGWSGPATA